jgi:hypothetical protein
MFFSCHLVSFFFSIFPLFSLWSPPNTILQVVPPKTLATPKCSTIILSNHRVWSYSFVMLFTPFLFLIAFLAYLSFSHSRTQLSRMLPGSFPFVHFLQHLRLSSTSFQLFPQPNCFFFFLSLTVPLLFAVFSTSNQFSPPLILFMPFILIHFAIRCALLFSYFFCR